MLEILFKWKFFKSIKKWVLLTEPRRFSAKQHDLLVLPQNLPRVRRVVGATCHLVGLQPYHALAGHDVDELDPPLQRTFQHVQLQQTVRVEETQHVRLPLGQIQQAVAGYVVDVVPAVSVRLGQAVCDRHHLGRGGEFASRRIWGGRTFEYVRKLESTKENEMFSSWTNIKGSIIKIAKKNKFVKKEEKKQRGLNG